MHVRPFLHKTLSPVMHLKRLDTLKEMVFSVLLHKRLSVTGLGRGLEGEASERSNIRKSDRFVGNFKLIQERKSIYKKIATLLIGAKIRPWIIVDWSHIPNTTHNLLRAALVTSGRALSLYEEVYPKELEANPDVHKNFLQTLKMNLPIECRPIIVTDAGFHNPWFREVQNCGWDYVGRIRGKKCYSLKGKNDWKQCADLKKIANSTGRFIGEIELTRKQPLTTNCFLIKRKRLGRVSLNKLGKKSYYKCDVEHSKSANEPWILISSLKKSYHVTKKVFEIYSARMQIEEGFRDLKSSKYGFGLEKAHTKIISRIENLLLIAMLASFIAWLTGIFAEKMLWHYKFQANSVKSKRVISLFFLGCRIIKKKFKIPLGSLFQLIDNNEIPLCCL